MKTSKWFAAVVVGALAAPVFANEPAPTDATAPAAAGAPVAPAISGAPEAAAPAKSKKRAHRKHRKGKHKHGKHGKKARAHKKTAAAEEPVPELSPGEGSQTDDVGM